MTFVIAEKTIESLGIEEIAQFKGRIEHLQKEFYQHFSKGTGEIMIFRAPGRVNLIGEHTDYNGLPVLPMAINRDILIACRPRPDEVVDLYSLQEIQKAQFSISKEIAPSATGNWDNYVRAAAQALQRYVAGSSPLRSSLLKGFEGIVDGNIPPGSGLSSSSAMVVAVAVALADINQLKIEKKELADLCAKGERYVGTQGGGMDQAISVMGKKGYALKIDFFPLRTEATPLSSDYAFVICNSTVVAEKSGAAQRAYNQRTVECRLGVLLYKKDIREEKKEFYQRLGDIPSQDYGHFLNDLIDQDKYTLEAISRRTKVSMETIKKEYLTFSNGSIFHDYGESYQIRKRCRHVITEGQRVEDSKRVLFNGDFQKFGQLMDESFRSCALDYEISCPSIDRLIQICKSAGALGSRITGAGFGGCIVNLLDKKRVAFFIESVSREYYQNYLKKSREFWQSQILLSSACSGAGRLA